MASLIDNTYFVGDLHIASLSNSLVLARLTSFITKYEGQLLQDLLGYPLYKAFKAVIDEADPAQKWKDLRDGVEYTDVNDRTRKWMGLRDSTSKRSIVANYVYYWWLRDKASATTEIGEVTDKAEATQPAQESANVKMVRAYNEMVEWIAELIMFLNSKVDDYPEWEDADVYSIRTRFKAINRFNL